MGSDVLLPYRHFVHWSVSKAAILLYALLAGTVASVPFAFGIWGVLWYVRSFPAGKATESVLNGTVDSVGVFQVAAIENFWPLTLATVLLALIITIYLFFFAYGYYLLSATYRSYVEGSALPVLKNAYFDRRRMGKFLGVFGWVSLYVGIPLLAGLLAFLAVAGFVAYSGYAEGNAVTDTVLGTLVTVIVAATVGTTAYVTFRTAYSGFFLLAADLPAGSAKSYVAESSAATKSKFWKIVARMLPFILLVAAAEGAVRWTENSLAASRAYDGAVAVRAAAGSQYEDDKAFLKERLSPYMETGDFRDLADVFNGYEGKSEGIDRDFFDAISPYLLDISEFDPNGWAYESAFNLLAFFLFEGVLLMAFFSSYVRWIGPVRSAPSEPKPAPSARAIKTKKPEAAASVPSEKSAAPAGESEMKTAKKKPAAKKSAEPKKSPSAKSKSPKKSETERA